MGVIPIFDIVCNGCHILKEDVMIRAGKDVTTECPECGELMEKKPAFGSFELKYDNKKDICDWDGNTSQYYRAFKEAKDRGEDVKPGDED